MDTLTVTKNSSTELQKRIQAHLEALAQATDEARKGKEMQCYLDFCAKFHNYSPGNIWLILFARPDASLVAGFQKWKSIGRFVRKGEQGLPILAPILVKQEDEDGLEKQMLIGFKVVYVYDVTQTEGEPLPKPPDWKSTEKNLELNERLIQYANSLGITVSFKTLPKEIQGVSKGGAIDIDLAAGTHTLLHEISHELLHKGKDNLQSREIKELQAEAVAYIVSRHLGLGGLKSANYLALWNVTPEQLLTHLEIIRSTADKIVTAITVS
jgi:hypothetical protein